MYEELAWEPSFAWVLSFPHKTQSTPSCLWHSCGSTSSPIKIWGKSAKGWSLIRHPNKQNRQTEITTLYKIDVLLLWFVSPMVSESFDRKFRELFIYVFFVSISDIFMYTQTHLSLHLHINNISGSIWRGGDLNERGWMRV